jgi:hypothetical protein
MIMTPEHTEAQWASVVDFVRSEVENVIKLKGKFDLSKIAGALVGTKDS